MIEQEEFYQLSLLLRVFSFLTKKEVGISPHLLVLNF